MASLSFDNSKDGYRLSFRDADKRKRAIWLGKVSAAKAEDWKTHVEHLLDVASRDEPPHKATAASLPGRG